LVYNVPESWYPAIMRLRQPKSRFISLFSGCGGLDLGFTQAGFECANAYDSDPAAVETHRSNFGSIAKLQDLATTNIVGEGRLLSSLPVLPVRAFQPLDVADLTILEIPC